MSCYFRHLGDILGEAGIEVTPGNRKQIDQVIHRLVEVAYKDCPTTWKALKRRTMDDKQKRRELVKKLQDEIV